MQRHHTAHFISLDYSEIKWKVNIHEAPKIETMRNTSVLQRDKAEIQIHFQHKIKLWLKLTTYIHLSLFIGTAGNNMTDFSARCSFYTLAGSWMLEELFSMRKSHNALAIRQESLITALWGLAYHQQQFLCGKYSHNSLWCNYFPNSSPLANILF